MQAEIITIGDEILIGQIVDTNSAWMGQQLNDVGIKVHQITSVSDNREHILLALNEARQRVQIVLITGGLGPTKDDITKKTLCEYFNVDLTFNTEVYKDIEHLFSIRGREVTPINRKQAEVPSNCIPLQNRVGTAPGMWFDDKGCLFISMPGVPYEMEYLMKNEVIPRLKQKFKTPFILHRTLLTQGIGESFLSEKIADFEDALPTGFKLAYLPSPGMVRLRLTASGEESHIRETMSKLSAELEEQIKDYLYGYDEDSIEEILGKLLQEKNLTISTAESCTGGYIAHLLTSVPGSSAYYMGSTVTYSYKSKSDILGIPVELINTHGAVSEEVVIAMAEGVRKKFGTDCSIATSGIAGPAGGTPEKPVGLVWIGICTPTRTFARKVMLGNDRLRTIKVAAGTSINMLRKALL
jgi:nicotinamide-nucleotide amidase